MRKQFLTHCRTLGAALLALGLAAGIATSANAANGVYNLSASPNAMDRLTSIDMEIGKSAVVKTDFPVKRVSVGSPEVLEVVVLSPTEVQLVPASKGSTNLIFWDRKGMASSVVDISVGNSFGEIERKLRSVLGSSDINVEALGEGIILSGSVGGPVHVERASAIAASFFAKNGDERVVNALEVGGNQQVMLEVVIAEMQRSIGHRLTTNFNGIVASGSKLYTFGSFLGDLTAIDTFDPGGTSLFDLTERIDLAGSLINGNSVTANAFIQATTDSGLAKILAKPTLLARSGQSASFLAGGEIPIPVAQGGAFGSITVDYKEFGVGVEFAPTVLGDNRIYLEIAPEVSEIDFTLGTAAGGVVTPGFVTRRASTSVELADGQSFAIAGLLQDNIRENVDKFPLLGDIPVLGALFRSSEFQRNETELVMIVTPRLVKPMTGDFHLPTDAFVEPSAFEFFMFGAMEARHNTHADSDDSASLMGPAGYRLPADLEETNR